MNILCCSMDAVGTPYMTEFASCWGLLAGSLVIASPVVFLKIKEHTDVEADLNFSDETAQEVGVPLEDHPSEKKQEPELAIVK